MAGAARYPELYYKVWYYFPQLYTVTGQGFLERSAFGIFFQWKSKAADPPPNDPFFSINIDNGADGSMYLYVYDSNAQVRYYQWSPCAGRPLVFHRSPLQESRGHDWTGDDLAGRRAAV